MLSPKALTDFNRLRDVAGISARLPTVDYGVFESLINTWSEYIHGYTRFPSFRYQTVTEYHDGKGIPKLRLENYPIISVTNIYEDANRTFTTALDSDDYTYYPETGIICKLGATFAKGVRTIKVVYVAGYSEFEIITGYNDTLAITDSGGSSDVSTTSGSYNISTLCTELETQLNADATLAGTYTVSYSESGSRVTISCDETFSTSYGIHTGLAHLLGLDTEEPEQDVTSLVGEYPVRGLPADLTSCCEELVLWSYRMVKEDQIGVMSEGGMGELSRSFDYANIPTSILNRLDYYKRLR